MLLRNYSSSARALPTSTRSSLEDTDQHPFEPTHTVPSPPNSVTSSTKALMLNSNSTLASSMVVEQDKDAYTRDRGSRRPSDTNEEGN